MSWNSLIISPHTVLLIIIIKKQPKVASSLATHHTLQEAIQLTSKTSGIRSCKTLYFASNFIYVLWLCFAIKLYILKRYDFEKVCNNLIVIVKIIPVILIYTWYILNGVERSEAWEQSVKEFRTMVILHEFKRFSHLRQQNKGDQTHCEV